MLRALVVGAVVLTAAVVTVGAVSKAPPEQPFQFRVDFGLWGGVELTVRAKSAESCESARNATVKKLLQEASGLVRYKVGKCESVGSVQKGGIVHEP